MILMNDSDGTSEKEAVTLAKLTEIIQATPNDLYGCDPRRREYDISIVTTQICPGMAAWRSVDSSGPARDGLKDAAELPRGSEASSRALLVMRGREHSFPKMNGGSVKSTRKR